MSKNVIESVFVAWGGNQPLARLVAAKLRHRHFEVIVGGENPTGMFVGTQVLAQIHRCTRAVILLEDVAAARTASGLNFNDNLMFEWGYVTGTFDPSKVHVFLIGVSTRDLPSDLAGAWASEVGGAGQSPEEVAEQIALSFTEDATHYVEVDKLQIMHMWSTVLTYLERYEENPACSEIELANYLLHSIESCYYHMEEDRLESLLEAIRPVARVLECASQIVRANIQLFRETNGLQSELSLESFAELKAIFTQSFDFDFHDRGLSLWFDYFAKRRLSLLYSIMSRSDMFDPDEKSVFIDRTDGFLTESFGLLDQIVEESPSDAIYVNLYRGFIFRDRYLIHAARGELEEARVANAGAVLAKEAFYLAYKDRFPQDALMIRHLAQEYYLSLAESLAFMDDPAEKTIVKRTVRSYLSKLEVESGRQHVVLDELRARFS